MLKDKIIVGVIAIGGIGGAIIGGLPGAIVGTAAALLVTSGPASPREREKSLGAGRADAYRRMTRR